MFHPDDGVLADVALGEPATGSTRAHLSGCPACAAEVEALSTTLAVLRAAPVEPVVPPRRVWDAVQSTILLDDAPAASRVDASSRVTSDAELLVDRHTPVTEATYSA